MNLKRAPSDMAMNLAILAGVIVGLWFGVSTRVLADGDITSTLEVISGNVAEIAAGALAMTAEIHRVAVVDLLAVGLLVCLIIVTAFKD